MKISLLVCSLFIVAINGSYAASLDIKEYKQIPNIKASGGRVPLLKIEEYKQMFEDLAINADVETAHVLVQKLSKEKPKVIGAVFNSFAQMVKNSRAILRSKVYDAAARRASQLTEAFALVGSAVQDISGGVARNKLAKLYNQASKDL